MVEPGTGEHYSRGLDANEDEIEILFPSAPGVLELIKKRAPVIGISLMMYPITFQHFQVLAVDEQGASDVLFVNLEVKQELDSATWDSGLWDTGWWEEPYHSGMPYLTGDINVENGFSGLIEYRNAELQCRIPPGICRRTTSPPSGVVRKDMDGQSTTWIHSKPVQIPVEIPFPIWSRKSGRSSVGPQSTN